VADPVVVVGGSVAALVAADALGRRGDAVELHLPERGIGSGFLPIEAGGRKLELGPRIVELAYDDAVGAAPPLESYRPGPHGHRPFLALVQQFVLDLAGDDLAPIRGPEIVLDGRRGGDVILGGDLSSLATLLAPDDRVQIASEARHQAADEGPRGLLDPSRQDELWSSTFAEASMRNHGPTFHARVIDAIAGKILPGGSSAVIAALRRKIWLPLFWPETLAAACDGTLAYRPARPMHTIAGGGMGAVVQRLLDRIDASRFVVSRRVARLVAVERAGGGYVLRYDGGAETTARAVVAGCPPEELFGAVGVEYAPDRVRAAIAWLDVDDDHLLDAPSVVFAADESVDAFRVSESTAESAPGRHTFCCELRAGVDPTDLDAAAPPSLVQLGVVADARDATVVRSGVVDAFATPGFANAHAFAAAQSAFEGRNPGVEVVGGALSFAADSFNEQVVQGLRAAARLS
jgi:hypothetical protein